jgi:hypothetical protein
VTTRPDDLPTAAQPRVDAGTPAGPDDGPPSAWIGAVEILLLLALLGGFVWMLWMVIAVAAPLGHDEAVYAAQSRHWLAGTPDDAWGLHRAPLLPILGLGVLTVTEADAALRLLGVLFGVGAVAGVWWLARSIVAPGVAVLGDDPHGDASRRASAAVAGVAAAAVLATARPVVSAAGFYLTDLPAAALLVGTAGVLWHGLELRRVPSWEVVLAAPLAAAAFYMRFGSTLFITLLGLTAVVLWWPRIRRHPAPVLVAGLLFVLLLVPHMVGAVREFGTPWGQVLYTSGLVADVMEEPGLPTYVRTFPSELAGTVAAVMMAIGLLAGLGGLAVAVVRRRWGRVERAWVLLLVPALVFTTVIGVRASADTRFLFAPLALLVTAGGVGGGRAVHWLARTAGRGWAFAALGVMAAGMAAGATIVPGLLADGVESREGMKGNNDPIRVLAQTAGERSDGPCLIVSSYAPQSIWYSGCSASTFSHMPPERLADDPTPNRWLLLFDGGKNQPEGEELQAYLDLTPGEPDVRHDRGGGLIKGGQAYRITEGG